MSDSAIGSQSGSKPGANPGNETADSTKIHELRVHVPWRVEQPVKPAKGPTAKPPHPDHSNGNQQPTTEVYPNQKPVTPDASTRRVYDATHNGVVKIQRTDTTKGDCPPELTSIFGKSAKDCTTTTYENGSGFYFDKDGDIITNAHVVVPNGKASSSELTVIDESGKKHSAHIVSIDPSKDLAKIKIDDGPTPPDATVLSFAPDSKTPKPGDPLWVEGHPQGSPDLYVSPGTIARQGPNSKLESQSYIRDKGHAACAANATKEFAAPGQPDAAVKEQYLKASQYEASVHIEPGNSGGPAFNRDGQVIGVAVKGDMPIYNGYFIQLKDVREFAQSTQTPYKFVYKPDPTRPERSMLVGITGPEGASPAPPSLYDFISQRCSPKTLSR